MTSWHIHIIENLFSIVSVLNFHYTEVAIKHSDTTDHLTVSTVHMFSIGQVWQATVTSVDGIL